MGVSCFVQYFFRLALPIFVGIALVSAHAEDLELREYDGKIRLGLEIEMTAQPLSQIIRHFDFEAFQASHRNIVTMIPLEAVDAYLDDPANFDLLPQPLKTELARDLKHLQPTILSPAKTREKSTLVRVDPRGKPIPRGMSRTESGLIVPDNTQTARDWAEVVRRWHALSSIQKRSAIELKRLPAMVLAELVMEQKIKITALGIRSDLPEELKNLYSRLVWKYDGQGVVEFTYPDGLVISQPEQYLHDIRTLARMAGIWTRFQQPLASQVNIGHSFHTHLSTLEPFDLSEKGRAMNLLRFIQYFSEGARGVLGESHVAYRNHTSKGMVRVLSPSHVEDRAPIMGPEEELKQLLRYMYSDTAVFEDLKIALETKFTEDFVARIIQGLNGAPPHLLTQLFVDLEALKSKISFDPMPALRPVLDRLALSDDRNNIYTAVRILLYNYKSPIAQDAAASWVKEPKQKAAILELLRVAESTDPAKAATFLPALLRSPDEHIREATLQTISKNFHNPSSELLEVVSEQLRPENGKKSAALAENILENAKGNWTETTFERMITWGSEQHRQFAIAQFSKHTEDPEPFQKIIEKVGPPRSCDNVLNEGLQGLLKK